MPVSRPFRRRAIRSAGCVVMSRQNLAAGAAPIRGSRTVASKGRPASPPTCARLAGPGLARRRPTGPALRRRACPRSACNTRPAARRCNRTPSILAPGAATTWTFFGAYQPDHPAASTDADLAVVDAVDADRRRMAGARRRPRRAGADDCPRRADRRRRPLGRVGADATLPPPRACRAARRRRRCPSSSRLARLQSPCCPSREGRHRHPPPWRPHPGKRPGECSFR